MGPGFLATICLLALFAASSANAAKVVNPGEVKLYSRTTGTLVATGTVNRAGELAFAYEDVSWPVTVAQGVEAGGSPEFNPWRVEGTSANAPTGTLDPAARGATIAMQAMQLDFVANVIVPGIAFTAQCQLGALSTTFDVALSTFPDIEDEALGPLRYDQQTGRLDMVMAAEALPDVNDLARDCDFHGSSPLDDIALASCAVCPALVKSFADAVDLLTMNLRLRPVIKSPVQVGTARGETMTGTKYAETLRALGGADVLKPLGGRDKVYGGGGADTIYARDQKPDVISCGAGRDRVRADVGDSLSGCEKRF
jgi:hypothetical protein